MSGAGASSSTPVTVGGPLLRVDPIACEGVGLCAHVAPDVVDLDRWGYPIVPSGALTHGVVGQASRAVRGCPRRALWLQEA